MNEISAIRRLLEFHRLNEGSISPLLEFIATDTLKTFSPISLFLGVVRSNGAIFIPFTWGPHSEMPKAVQETYLDERTPGYDAYAHGKIVEAGNVREYPFYYPENVPVLFPNGFEASWITPVPGFGALLMFCSAATPRTTEIESLLLAVGEILSISLTHGDHGVKFEIDKNEIKAVTLLPLTPRQWAIKEAMLRGLTNGAIAREMNFSESLIRHETIRIYSKLGINGRKELFTLESAAVLDDEKLEA